MKYRSKEGKDKRQRLCMALKEDISQDGMMMVRGIGGGDTVGWRTQRWRLLLRDGAEMAIERWSPGESALG